MVQQDDSTSEESPVDEPGPCDSTAIKKKDSFIRRLKRILQWLLLPSDAGIPAPYSISYQKLLLKSYFMAAGIDPAIYNAWFIPISNDPVVNNPVFNN